MATHQTAKTQYAVRPDGTKFAYRRLGASAGTPLLILTHFRGVMDVFDPLLANLLAASRSIIEVDYAGCGLSTGRVASTVKESADDIIDFLGIIGETEVDILGFSLGGFVTQAIALNADPTKLKVRKIILSGTGPSHGADVLPTVLNGGPNAGAATPIIETFQELFFPETREGAIAVRQWWARIHERSEQTSGEETANFVSNGWTDEGKGFQAQLSQILKWGEAEASRGENGSYDRLPDLDIPILVVNGHDDKMVPTPNSFVIQQRTKKGQLIVYPNSGHGSIFQYATLFSKHALLFLEA